MKRSCRTSRTGVACLTLCVALCVPTERRELKAADDAFPAIRRIKVPADRLDLWPKGDWQPIPLTELERQIDRAAAGRRRPAPFIERAIYSATFVDGELQAARLEWHVRRPDSFLSLLPVGQMNLNVSELAWSDPESQTNTTRYKPVPALWGTTPEGATGIVVDRRQGRLVGEWVCSGRPLSASTEFDVELPPAAMSQLTVKVPEGLILTSTAGEVSSTASTSQPGWNDWRVNPGSRTSARLRIAARTDSTAARPLLIVRSNVNYSVRSEAARILAEFALESLETVLREVRLSVDPEIQVTSVENGDGGAVAWQSTPIRDGRDIVVQLSDSPGAEGQSLRVQGISQIKQFAAWTLPRIRVQNSVEESGKVTLRIQHPLQAADIRTEGYLQTELTTSDAEGESLVFKQTRPDGAITIVPADGKPDLTCRAVTLLTCESNQWTFHSQVEWKAAAGNAFAARCLIPEMWEIVDVRPAAGEDSASLSGWDVEELGSGKRMLHVFFLNALAVDRPQRVRITGRRLPPVTGKQAPREQGHGEHRPGDRGTGDRGTGEQAAMPPLIPSDADEVEHYVVVTTGPDWRPVIEARSEIELLTIRDLPASVTRIDFLSSQLSDRQAHFLAFKTFRSPAGAQLSLEPFERTSVFPQHSVGNESQSEITPDSPSEPEAALVRSATSAPLEMPVAMDVKVQVSDLSSGFDHIVAKVRLPVRDDRLTFRWTLAETAQLTGVTVAGHRVVPSGHAGSYSIEDLPIIAYDPVSADILVVEIEYRVPAALHAGPNSRKLVLPVPVGPMLHFGLELVVPDRIRLTQQPSGIRLAGFDEQSIWHRRLLGPFARPAGKPIFNPFSLASWSTLPGFAASDFAREANQPPEHERVWRASTAALPEGAEFVIWSNDETFWLSIGALALCALVSIGMRLAQSPLRQGAACFAIALLCFGTLTLPPVEAEIAGSALTGLVLAILLPQRVLEFARRQDLRSAEEFPLGGTQHGDVAVGSTQSFIPLAGIVLAAVVFGLGVVAQAQNDRKPVERPAERSVERGAALADQGVRQVFDVLIPVAADGKPVGTSPLAYTSAELLTRLRRTATTAALPAWLLGAASFDAQVDESNQLLVLARFDVYVLASEPVVRVCLPLGKVNLGGADACLVDGQPHSLIAPIQGSGVLLELPGVPPTAPVPVVPDTETAPEKTGDAMAGAGEILNEPTAVRTYRVELKLHPPIDGGRADISSALVTVPPGCRTQATLSSSIALPVAGIVPTDLSRSPMSQRPNSDAKSRIGSLQNRSVRTRRDEKQPVQVRPGPTSQIMFFWSAVAGDGTLPVAELQTGISCLADVSRALIQLRYHIAYHVQAGHADSLLWQVPAGYVLQSVQAPQLAGYRFRSGQDGGREMLLEFSRPQEEDFSLAATFVLSIDRRADQFTLALLDPWRSAGEMQQNIGLRFHQFALRQPSDLRVTISSPAADQALKPRPVKEFLKEWNAAGARPQQAFDLARLFTLQLDVESMPAQPAVRGSSAGRFRPGRLDWSYLAEIEQPLVGQFIYRLHVDPRLKIQAVSVQEEGGERLLRWSQMRETVVLLLNDKATRLQTVRIDASLPMSSSQEIELPRIRFAGATPGPERITLYRDADLNVRLANPEDFPLSPVAPSSASSNPSRAVPARTVATPVDPSSMVSDREINGGHERLVARLDFLPEQAVPRVLVEPVLPQIAAETSTILEQHAGAWKLTHGIRFRVLSGKADVFSIDLPQTFAARFEVKANPTSRTSAEPQADGRIRLTLHPDEPVDHDFVVLLTGTVEMPGGIWRQPAIGLPGTEQTDSVLVVPSEGFESVAALPGATTDVPAWIKALVPELAPNLSASSPVSLSSGMAPNSAAGLAPALATGGSCKMYRWSGAAPALEFRATRDGSSQSGVDRARYDIWLEPDGSIQGWAGLTLSENPPALLELDWPHSARLIALYVAGDFLELPAPESGRLNIALPPSAKRGLVWLSWSAPGHLLPAVSGPFAAHVPWPRNIPVGKCGLNVHSPPRYRFETAAPFAVTDSRSQVRGLPALVSQTKEWDSSSAAVSLDLPPARPGADTGAVTGATAGAGFTLTTALRVVNEWPRQLVLAAAAALLLLTLSWKTAPFWRWLSRHETTAWLTLSLIWCVWLDPSWFGPLLALWACTRAILRRDRTVASLRSLQHVG